MNLDTFAAMIAPAVLLSGCGTLILSTSNRLTRASDRVRILSERVRTLELRSEATSPHEEWQLIHTLLPKLIRRVRLLHRCLNSLYLSVEFFVLSSLVIGGSGLLGFGSGALPLCLGMAGVLVLSYATAMLTMEGRLSLSTNVAEMEFIQRHAENRISRGFANDPMTSSD